MRRGSLLLGRSFTRIHGRIHAANKRGVSISCVYIPPEFREKGYASAVVASLSKLALESGKEFCTLYTDLSNLISNNIYQRIGYGVVADVMEVNFTNTEF